MHEKYNSMRQFQKQLNHLLGHCLEVSRLKKKPKHNIEKKDTRKKCELGIFRKTGPKLMVECCCRVEIIVRCMNKSDVEVGDNLGKKSELARCSKLSN